MLCSTAQNLQASTDAQRLLESANMKLLVHLELTVQTGSDRTCSSDL